MQMGGGAHEANKYISACSGDTIMPYTGTQQHWNPDSNSEDKRRVQVDLRPPWRACWWQTFLRDTCWTLQRTAVSTVRGAAGGSHQSPAFCLVTARLKVPPWQELCIPLFDPVWPPNAVRLHLEVSADPVVLHHRAGEVDDPTLIRALVRWLDIGEAELVWDVAPGHFYHLKKFNEL